VNKLSLAAALLLTVGLSQPAPAQEYPQQTIKFVIAFGPGGGADIIGRILAESMSRKLSKPIIVENKPGAGGILGNDAVAKAAPDGYTLGVMTAGQIIAAVTKKSMPYDTNTAFAPVSQIATASLMIVVRPDFPANDVKELIAVAKKDPGKIVFASPGFAATQHFAGEMFKQVAGIELLHVPYKTTPEAINAVLGKHADVLFDTVSAVIGQVQSGQLKALAVTGKDRFPAVPNVPAAVESGVMPGYDVTTWYGLFAPAGTPEPVLARLRAEVSRILQQPDLRERLLGAGGIETWMTSPAEFSRAIRSDHAKFARLARELAVKID
jgi:tripartite-type tricarboxylate transporter receptor subunit TctC